MRHLTSVAILVVVGVLSAGCAYGGLNEPPKDFRALFNGKDLSGWKGLVDDPKSRANRSEE